MELLNSPVTLLCSFKVLRITLAKCQSRMQIVVNLYIFNPPLQQPCPHRKQQHFLLWSLSLSAIDAKLRAEFLEVTTHLEQSIVCVYIWLHHPHCRLLISTTPLWTGYTYRLLLAVWSLEDTRTKRSGQVSNLLRFTERPHTNKSSWSSNLPQWGHKT